MTFSVEDARRYRAATYSIGMGAARLSSRSVDLSGRKSMLDLGGGSGAYSIVATKTYPGLEAIVFDLPPVTLVADECIAANGGDRPRQHPAGRLHRDAFSRPASTSPSWRATFRNTSPL